MIEHRGFPTIRGNQSRRNASYGMPGPSEELLDLGAANFETLDRTEDNAH